MASVSKKLKTASRSLLIFLMVVVIMQSVFWRPAVAGDGELFFGAAHELVFDRTNDLRNEFLFFEEQYGTDSPYDDADVPIPLPPPGSALIALPAYLFTHLVMLAAASWGAAVVPDGLSFPYQFAFTLSSTSGVVFGLLLLFRSLRTLFSEREALFATALTWIATPLVYYQVLEPSMAHAFGFFATALFVFGFTHARKGLTEAGRLLGFLTRWPLLLLYAVLPKKEALRRTVFALALAAAVGVVTLIIDREIIAAVLGSFNLFPVHLFPVLFSPTHGFLATPILFVALAGLFLRSPARRYFLPAVLGALYFAAILKSWEGGWSFGARRFVEFLPLLAFGLAEVIRRIRLPWFWPVVLGILGALNIVFMSAQFAVPRHLPLDLQTTISRITGSGLQRVAAAVESSFIYRNLFHGFIENSPRIFVGLGMIALFVCIAALLLRAAQALSREKN